MHGWLVGLSVFLGAIILIGSFIRLKIIKIILVVLVIIIVTAFFLCLLRLFFLWLNWNSEYNCTILTLVADLTLLTIDAADDGTSDGILLISVELERLIWNIADCLFGDGIDTAFVFCALTSNITALLHGVFVLELFLLDVLWWTISSGIEAGSIVIRAIVAGVLLGVSTVGQPVGSRWPQWLYRCESVLRFLWFLATDHGLWACRRLLVKKRGAICWWSQNVDFIAY